MAKKTFKKIKRVGSAVNKASKNPLIRTAVSMAPGGAQALAVADQTRLVGNQVRNTGRDFSNLSAEEQMNAVDNIVQDDRFQGIVSETGDGDYETMPRRIYKRSRRAYDGDY